MRAGVGRLARRGSLLASVAVLVFVTPPLTASAADVSGVIVVGFVPGVDQAKVHSFVTGHLDAVVVDTIPKLGAALVQVADTARARLLYRGQLGVRFAEPPVEFRLSDAPGITDGPTDPLAVAQYNLERIGAFEAYQAVFGGAHPYALPPFAGAPVAIIDSGVDVGHPDLLPPKSDVARCVSFLPWPFAAPAQPPVTAAIPGCADTVGHGTHVAGLAAAWTDNANGMAAPAVRSSIIAVKAFWSLVAWDWEISKAIVYAADAGAKVINMSFGADERSELQSSAVAYAESKDALTVAASGNVGDGTMAFPACESDLAVGATSLLSRSRARFSSYGCVDVAAPGELVMSTLPGGGYGPLDGTSMASPQVAGVAAMLRSLGASRTAAVNAILSTATPAGSNVGKGEVDFHAAVHAVSGS